MPLLGVLLGVLSAHAAPVHAPLVQINVVVHLFDFHDLHWFYIVARCGQVLYATMSKLQIKGNIMRISVPPNKKIKETVLCNPVASQCISVLLRFVALRVVVESAKHTKGGARKSLALQHKKHRNNQIRADTARDTQKQTDTNTYPRAVASRRGELKDSSPPDRSERVLAIR